MLPTTNAAVDALLPSLSLNGDSGRDIVRNGQKDDVGWTIRVWAKQLLKRRSCRCGNATTIRDLLWAAYCPYYIVSKSCVESSFEDVGTRIGSMAGRFALTFQSCRT
ncbi:hypothetical protein quinque_006916 [Culex quinquefasciatus]